MEEKIYDGSQVMTKEEAKAILKDKNAKISNGNINSFVSLKDINKIYPNGAQAVYNFNLDINKHDFIVLVGPSGCGKSTTLRMIAGLEDITSGYLYIDKEMANSLESKDRDISMVFQSYALYPQMTVYDNIGFPLTVRKFTRRAVDESAFSYNRLAELLTNELTRVRKGLSNIEHIKDKMKRKLHYLERYLSCNKSVASELIANKNLICDDFTLNIYGQLEQLEKYVNDLKASLKHARVVLDDDLNVVEDGRVFTQEAFELKGAYKVCELLDTDIASINKAIIAAYDPRGPKKKDPVAKVAKELEIEPKVANILVEHRVALAIGDANSVAQVKDAINNLIATLAANPGSVVDASAISEQTIAEVEDLKAGLYYLDLGKNHFKDLHEIVKSGALDNVSQNILQILTQFSADDLEARQVNINALIDSYINAREARIAELYAQGIELTEKFELIENGEEVYVEKKLSKDEAREKIFNAANVLDLGPYLDRRPKELSGGQMQRVALGRAIVRDAKLFLMDEPLSNLDAKLRVAMRSEIVRLHESIGATTIYVTHDQTEAMTMATRIVIMSKGWVQQVGTPTEVYENPKNLFVATFIGSPAMNIVDGRLNGSILTLRDGYEIDLGPDFINKHDDFYKRKIVECEEMLNTLNNEVEVKCYTILQEVRELCKKYAANRETIEYLLSTIVELARSLNKKSRDDLVGAAEQACAIAVEDGAYSHDLETAIVILNNMLVNYETINNGDIEKIHSAQAFQKETAVKADDTLVYKGRKHEFFWHRMAKKRKAKALKRRGPKVQIEDPEGYLHDLKAAYERALVEGHNVKLGIRPENVFLAKDNIKVNATKPFTTNVDVVELMGSEALVHSKFNGIDFLAKITSGTPVESHEAVEYVLDKDKIHIFDVNSGETII